jgi:antirestriction protein ArdC
MIADIGASMLARLVGMELQVKIDPSEEDVLRFWIQALEENKRFIVHVASAAQKTVQYLLSY